MREGAPGRLLLFFFFLQPIFELEKVHFCDIVFTSGGSKRLIAVIGSLSDADIQLQKTSPFLPHFFPIWKGEWPKSSPIVFKKMLVELCHKVHLLR